MKKEVAHVETQEQYDYVLSKIENKKNLDDLHYTAYKYNTCINLDTECYGSLEYYTEEGYKIISFDEFKSRYELKIGDTFEHNGFVCEVKENIEKNIWFLLRNKHTKSITYRYAKESEFDWFNNDEDVECIKITNKEFIKQLEENALS